MPAKKNGVYRLIRPNSFREEFEERRSFQKMEKKRC